jgi:hypothetical protein
MTWTYASEFWILNSDFFNLLSDSDYCSVLQ